jgi:hypothetical protein
MTSILALSNENFNLFDHIDNKHNWVGEGAQGDSSEGHWQNLLWLLDYHSNEYTLLCLYYNYV